MSTDESTEEADLLLASGVSDAFLAVQIRQQFVYYTNARVSCGRTTSRVSAVSDGLRHLATSHMTDTRCLLIVGTVSVLAGGGKNINRFDNTEN